MHRSLSSLAVVAVLAAAPAAIAQTYARYGDSLYDRPATRAASTTLGGRFTFAPARALAAAQRDVSLLGQDPFQFAPQVSARSRDRRRALPVVNFGLNSPLSAPSGFPLSAQFAYTGEIAVLSGVSAEFDIMRPLPSATGYLPSASGYLYTPRDEQSLHAQYFGHKEPVDRETVRRPTPREQAQMAAEAVSYSQAVEVRTQRRVAVALRDALNDFRSGTVEMRDPGTGAYPSCTDCDLRMFKALQGLELVQDLDAKNGLAPLLLAHIALERQRPLYATHLFVRAYERDPAVFGPDHSLHSYYGDVSADGISPRLDSQMRLYARATEELRSSGAVALLEAYCAFRLGDSARARDAVLRFEQSEDIGTMKPAARGLADMLRTPRP